MSDSPARFSRYLLRTTDAEAAAAFYDAVIEGRGDGIVPLHEAAIALCDEVSRISPSGVAVLPEAAR